MKKIVDEKLTPDEIKAAVEWAQGKFGNDYPTTPGTRGRHWMTTEQLYAAAMAVE